MWANKYRPQVLDEVLGQEVSKKLISGALRKRLESRSWLVTGPHGTGKTTFVRIIARGLTCPNQRDTGEGCGACPTCLSVNSESSPNYTEVDAASFGSADRIRQLVQEAHLAPVGDACCRVMALDEVHALSSAAQDVLLKTLEETPPSTHFVLLTTNPEKLKGTVLSRCLNLKLQSVDLESIISHLKVVCRGESVTFEDEALRVVASQKYGHVRDALTLAETISLTGPISLDQVKAYLGLNLRDEAFSLIEKSLVNWEESLSLGQSLCDQYNPSDLWNVTQSILIEADFRRRALNLVGTDEAMNRLVGLLGDHLSSLTEWLLGKARNFSVTSYADLMVVLALALDQVGLIKSAGDQTTEDTLGSATTYRANSLDEGEELSLEEFAAEIGFVIDDSED